MTELHVPESRTVCGKCGHGMHWHSCDTLVLVEGGMGVCLCRNDVETMTLDPNRADLELHVPEPDPPRRSPFRGCLALGRWRPFSEREAMSRMGPVRLRVHLFLDWLYRHFSSFPVARRLWWAWRRTWPR